MPLTQRQAITQTAAEASKSGWMTSEFWATAFGALISILPFLYIVFRVKPEDQTALTDAVQTLGGLAVTAFSAVAVIWRYIASRQAVKEQTIAAHAQVTATEIAHQPTFRPEVRTPPEDVGRVGGT